MHASYQGRATVFAVAAVLLALVAAGTARVASADGTVPFADPAGDAAGGGPDVTAVAVTNDANGKITMNISVALAPTSGLLVLMDTDLNGQVADSTGRSILVVSGGPGIALSQPFANDSAGNPAPTTFPSLTVSSTPTSVSLSFAKGDAGIDKGFGFWIATFASPDQFAQGTLSDEAPDQAMYTYILTAASAPTVTPPPPAAPPAVVKPVIGAAVGTPAAPQAGKRFRATFAVTRSDDGAPLAGASATCSASAGGRAVQCRASFVAGSARAAVLTPKNTKGKMLRVRLTVANRDGSATRSAGFRIR